MNPRLAGYSAGRWTVRQGGRKSRQGPDQDVWESEGELGLYSWKGSVLHLERSL